MQTDAVSLHRWKSYMESLEVLEVTLLDLCDLVILQVEQGGVVWDVFGNLLQTWWRKDHVWELRQIAKAVNP